jgi:large subunit ribosomal protein L17
MAMIELVDFNELYTGGKKEVKKSKSRRGGKAKKQMRLLKLQLLRLILPDAAE